MNEREIVLKNIAEQRESRMKPYFDIWHGQPALRSQLPQEALAATEILIQANKFTEQKTLDGDAVISLNEQRTP